MVSDLSSIIETHRTYEYKNDAVNKYLRNWLDMGLVIVYYVCIHSETYMILYFECID